MPKRLNVIAHELKDHAPFTLCGAVTGIILMFLFKDVSAKSSETFFYLFHPAHVLLSAVVMSSMYIFHSKKVNLVSLLLIGFVGSVAVGTLSDSLIPLVGEKLLGLHPEAHIGFIEGWYIVNPAALLGIAIAYFWPRTKITHAGHILLSTWASAFHMLMALDGHLTMSKLVVSFIFLFLAVWLPCCCTDILFPLLFAKSDVETCHCHH